MDRTFTSFRRALLAALLPLLVTGFPSAQAEAAADWPIMAPGTTLTRVGTQWLPASLRGKVAALPILCDDGWSDDGQIASPVIRFFAVADGRVFAAVQCAGADADRTAIFENTPDMVRPHAFATLRSGAWTGTQLLDLVRIEPMTGVLISTSDAQACQQADQQFTYRLTGDSFVLLKAEARPCGGTWSTTYPLP